VAVLIISIIAAVSKNNVIGKNGKIPWKIPGEQKRFKELTTGKTIIMGRKSFEEIGKPLPNRNIIIVSRTKNYSFENCITVDSLSKAFELSKDEEEVFIAGGAQLYEATLPYADYLYLTIIDKFFDGDVYFPNFNRDDYIIEYEERIEYPIPYTYYTFKRLKE